MAQRGRSASETQDEIAAARRRLSRRQRSVRISGMVFWIGLATALAVVIVVAALLQGIKPGYLEQVRERITDPWGRSTDGNEDGGEPPTRVESMPTPLSVNQEATPAQESEANAFPTRSALEFRSPEDGMPITVLEEFESSFYIGCAEPLLESLVVLNSWSGNGATQLEIEEPAGPYFLIVTGDNFGPRWNFNSIYETPAGQRFQSLNLDRNLPDYKTDAQMWCAERTGTAFPSILHVDSSDLDWTVNLVISGSGDALPRELTSALSGYYGACLPLPPMESLRVAVIGDSRSLPDVVSLPFFGEAPHYFVDVHFQPTDEDWELESVNVSGNWESAGPTGLARADNP